jgi:transcriptional regulator with XRE-family HTH domain
VKGIDLERLLLDVGRRVAEIRAGQELTQEELAERAGLSARYVQRVEAGEENLTVRSLAMLGTILRAPVIAFFYPPVDRSVRRGRPPARRR